MKSNHGKIVLLFLFLCISSISIGCNNNSPGSETEAIPTETSIVLQPTMTLSPIPSPTVEPPLVILLAPAGSDKTILEEMQAILEDLTAREGFQLETRKEIIEGGINENVKLVVILSPLLEMLDLISEYPETIFLAIGFPDLEAANNMFVIKSSGGRADQQAFLAGYIAAVITPDWRVGIISQADSADGQAATQGFSNGVIFYCGLCRPAYPPFNQYPMTVELPIGSNQEQQIAVADALINSAVETVYIAPGAGSSELFGYFVDHGVKLIGAELPSPQIQDHWIVTIRTDLKDTIEQNWENLLTGQSGYNLGSPLVLMDINESLFSPGKQEFVNRLLGDLLNGYIDTGVSH